MRHIRNTLLAISWLLALAAPALAQSNPGLAYGQIPTAAQWNSFFSAKTDYPGYTPIGPSNVLATAPITATVAGQNVTIACATCLTNPYGSLLVINLNAHALQSALTGSVLQVGNANSTDTRVEVDVYAAVPRLSGVRADGTAASPTALQSGDELLGINSYGYNGSAFVGPQAGFRCYAAQTWTTGPHYGTYCDVATTANNGSTYAEVVRFENDGGITVPSTVTGGDEGAGTINAARLYVNGVAVATGSSTITANSTPTSGFGAGTLAYSDGSLIQASSGIVVAGVGQLALALGTITTNQDALNITATWNNAGTTFDAPIFENITNTASAAGSKIIDLQVGGSSQFALDFNGALSGNSYISWNGSTGVTISRFAGALTVDGPISAILTNAATTSAVCYNTSSGVFSYDGTLGTCNTSDERLKTFDHLPLGDALGKLISLSESAHFGYFHWNDPAQYGAGERIGAGAQTVASLYPELTDTGSNGYMSLAYDKLTVPIIQSLREIVDSCRAAADDNFCRQLLKKVNAR